MQPATPNAAEFDPFALGAVERVVATTESQREVWLADKLSPQASLAFNESNTLSLRGTLDVAALRGALQGLVQRHDSLRATISPDGTEALISAELAVDLPIVDLSALDGEQRKNRFAEAVVQSVETPFDLERGPLFRAALYRLDAAHHELLVWAHHVVCDGWSWGVLIEDLGALYAEQLGAAPSPDDAVSFSDYVAWATGEAASSEMQAHERYWLGRFSDSSLPVLNLPTDRPRAAVRTFSSRRVDHVIDAALVADVRKLGAKSGASLFAALFAGFAATLHRLTGQDDVVIGVPSAGQSASGMTSLVGHCVNLLPVRTAVDSSLGFDAFVKRCGAEILDAFEHQTVTYGTLLKKLPLRRDPSRLPLVSVMFNVDQAVKSTSDAYPGLAVQFSANPRHCENFELFVNAAQVDGALRLECQYNTDLFDSKSVERWLRSYEALLRAAVQGPQREIGRLDWLAAPDLSALHALQPAPTPFATSELMHSAFVRQAAAEPQRSALRAGAVDWRYSDLDERSNRLAHALRARGIGRGEKVGLCLARGPEMMVSLLAVLKAGATYVPLDPGFPPARLAYYAEDAHLALLLTESGVSTAPRQWRGDAAECIIELDADRAWLEQPPTALAPSALDAQPADAAYVIYTSGSTGKPKGVAVPHGAVVNFLTGMQGEPGIAADDKLAAVTTLSFDIAVLELMLPLTAGAQVVIVPRETAMDGNLLSAFLTEHRINTMQATPGMWRLLLDTAWQGGAGFKALVGGEALPPDLALELLDRVGQVWNMYGPTETTIWSTLWRVTRSGVVSRGVAIGRPIANTTVWILDENRQQCPIGVPGEICIGGDGVTNGYHERPELTAERFIADPYSTKPGARLYRTGDLGRWRNDGLLEHLGRLDFQVKVRGYRIELGEIEAACNDSQSVAQSVVVAREDQPGDVRLVAYLSTRPGAAFDEAALREQLRRRLPDYMLPQHIVVLPAIPLLPNGKVDRKALPIPDAPKPAADRARVAPRNDTERAVLAAMESVLNLPGLGVHDDFFAVGGHSLLAARLTSRLNRELELSLPLRTLFESPSAETLARAVDAARSAGQAKAVAIAHDPARRSAPLTPMQERIRFIEELHPGRVVYNTPSAHRLTGPMDLAAFKQALHDMVRRQPALRTYVAREGGSYRQAIADALEIELPIEDLSALPKDAREAELMRRMQAIVDTPMDIYTLPLFRVALYKLAEQEHAFLFMPHHLIWDGWSFDLLYDEMAAAYGAASGAGSAALPALSVTYGDYAQWFEDWMRGPEYDTQLRYWKQRFENAVAPKAPRPDRPRRAGMSGEGASEWVRTDNALTERLREVARSADSTLNMLTLAVYTAMMASTIGTGTIVVGIPVRGRMQAELEPVMGFFNNLLPVHFSVRHDQPVAEFVRDIKRELLEVFSNQDVPFERLAAEPEVALHTQQVGPYQALFSFQDARDRVRQWGGLSQQGILIFQKGATEDLGLWLMEVPHGLEGGLTYNADIYAASTAVALRDRYLELLARVAAKPDATIGELVDSTASSVAGRLLHLAAGGSDEAVAPAIESVSAAMVADGPALSSNELALAKIWAGLLEIDVAQIRANDSFFDLGGDSLMAMRAIESAASALGFRIDARRYIYESLAQLASPEAAQLQGGKPAPPREAPQSRGLIGRLFGRKTGS